MRAREKDAQQARQCARRGSAKRGKMRGARRVTRECACVERGREKKSVCVRACVRSGVAREKEVKRGAALLKIIIIGIDAHAGAPKIFFRRCHGMLSASIFIDDIFDDIFAFFIADDIIIDYYYAARKSTYEDTLLRHEDT